MKTKLVIIGASGHGKVVADIALKMNKWNNILFLDDDDTIKSIIGLEVIGKTTEAYKFKSDTDFFVAIGNNKIREKLQENLSNRGLKTVTLIHPSAVIGTDVEIDYGTVVMAGVVINSSSKIGKGCIINTGSCVEHDNIIEDYVHISPGAKIAGNVSVGKSSWLGIGSVVKNDVKITSNCMIGAGAVVIKDIEESGTYVGVPVKRIY